MVRGCFLGLGIFVVFISYESLRPTTPTAGAMAIAVMFAAMSLIPANLVCWLLVALATWCAGQLKRSARKAPPLSRRVIGGAVIAVAALLTWWLRQSAVAALPFAWCLTCGAYVASLLFRDDARPGRWADTSLVVIVGVGLASLYRPGFITDDPAGALLLPPAAWLAIQIWRSMGQSGHRVVRASADVAAALLLGTVLDLLVVWVANLTGLLVPVVARVCGLLSAVSAGSNQAWWYQAVPLLLAAVMFAVLGRWKDLAARAGGWALRSKEVRWAREMPGIGLLRPRLALQALSLSRRTMTSLHVGLLLASLVGVTAPVLAKPALLSSLRARYVITYRADLSARAETAAYQQLAREVSAASPSQRAAMRASVEDLSNTADVGSPGLGGGPATPSQLASAHHLGVLEGEYLEYEGLVPPGSEPSPPVEGSVTAEGADVAEEEAACEAAVGYEEEAGASAAAAIGTLLSVPSGNAAIQVLQEYLGGLAEDSAVADVFARLAKRFTGSGTDGLNVEQVLDPANAEEAAAEGEIGAPAAGGTSGDDGSSGGTGGGQTSGDDGSDGGTGGGGYSGGDNGSGAGGGDGE
jgi:hypothetical protein